ncbi:glycosyltransferase family 4 protein [Halocynthiibacter sp. C4]|uniref:glycosyltransferase family 4 protein n=1 Tax=Halocynthiibacter sp. C4 TaxID=2992758 RepID=UPI00237B15AF|nr:glycosyltransferase family 4 protein [Halocynthiibacter sp. C4]MDE0589454.1 glycosyltransferase family 4 protein [Halocynthiibacter sp. C4]
MPVGPPISDPNKINVLFPYVGGDDFGGSHISSLKLVEMLNDSGTFNAIVGLHRPTGKFPDFLADQGVPFTELPFPDLIEPQAKTSKSKPRNVADFTLKSASKMRKYINNNSIDIVHTNDGRMHLNWCIPTKLSRAEFVWHHRGDPTAKATNLLAPLFANEIITVSQFAKPSRPIRNIDHKWSVVHSPFSIPETVDRDAAKAALLSELGLPAGTRILGYFGELIERKRPVYFVEIVAEYAKAYPDDPVVGIVAGAVPTGARKLDQEMRARAEELGISDKIIELGFRSPIEPIMAATDILIVSALNEPFGRTLCESMHLGTAVVATDHGGNPEAITHGETGYLVDPFKPEAFVEPIRKLLTNNAKFTRITEAARERALREYTMETHLNGVLAAYKRLPKAGKKLQP